MSQASAAAAQVVSDPLALDVVVEPAPQAGPGAGQGLVRDLEDPLVAGHESRVDQHLDQPLVVGVRGDEAARDLGTDRLAIDAGRDQPQDQVAQQVSLLGATLP